MRRTLPTGRTAQFRSRTVARRLLWGVLFASPWIIGFLWFSVYPILSSLYYSFTSYDVLTPPVFVGFGNYQFAFRDPYFWTSLYNTVYFVLLAVPGSVATGFFLAVLMNLQIKFRSAFRTVFFLPSIIPVTATAMLWLWMYHPQHGVLNGMLRLMGLPRLPWLSSPELAKPSLILIHLWCSGGLMVIFLAALQDVPRHLYEAAKIDGAGWWAQMCHITIPMVTPAILFNLLTGLIGAFQYFTLARILTNGGPVAATEFYSLYLYRCAFDYFRMGYASALSWLLFILVVVVSLIIFRSSARWVYYAGGDA